MNNHTLQSLVNYKHLMDCSTGYISNSNSSLCCWYTHLYIDNRSNNWVDKYRMSDRNRSRDCNSLMELAAFILWQESSFCCFISEEDSIVSFIHYYSVSLKGFFTLCLQVLHHHSNLFLRNQHSKSQHNMNPIGTILCLHSKNQHSMSLDSKNLSNRSIGNMSLSVFSPVIPQIVEEILKSSGEVMDDFLWMRIQSIYGGSFLA
jgi:hypothetical protein